MLNGIEVVSADGESRPPDIVLSDVLIRRMSGVELGIKIAWNFPALGSFCSPDRPRPVSSCAKPRDDGYTFELFPKPIHPDELIAR